MMVMMTKSGQCDLCKLWRQKRTEMPMPAGKLCTLTIMMIDNDGDDDGDRKWTI